MALEAYALVSLAEAKQELSIEGNELDAQVERYVNDASLWCEHICARRLKARAVSFVRTGPPSSCLFVDPFPIDITAPVVVTVGGAVQTVWKQPADGAQGDFNVLVRSLVPGGEPDHFWRASGWGPASSTGPDNVSLTYTGGIADPVPQLLKDACLLLVQKVSRDAVQQLGSDVMSVQGSGAPGSMAWRGNPVPLEAQRKLEAFMLLRMAS